MFANVLKRKNWYHIDICIQTLYSVPSWSTFVSDYSLKSSWVWCNRLWGFLCHSSLQILPGSARLDGDRRWTVIFRSLQRCLIGFKSRPLKGIHGVVPKSLLHRVGCVLRVIVLLEGEQFGPVWGPELSGPGFHEGYIRPTSIQLFLNLSEGPSQFGWAASSR